MHADLAEYQRLIFGGSLIQKGHVDTQAKFRQLTAGVDLHGKRVLDVGCRRGGMCYEAWRAGARGVVGIDISPELIDEARRLRARYYPGAPIEFSLQAAEHISDEFDIVLLTGTLHYIENTARTFTQIARVVKEALLLDAWIVNDGAAAPLMQLTQRFDRAYWIPNRAGIVAMLQEHFGEVTECGQTVSPDDSYRVIFHCRKPRPKPVEALLVSGSPGSGKSTLGQGLAAGRYYLHCELDRVSGYWVGEHNLVNIAYMSELWRGKHLPEIMERRREILRSMLRSNRNRDLVIEGYELQFDDERRMVTDLLHELGWTTVRERRLGARDE